MPWSTKRDPIKTYISFFLYFKMEMDMLELYAIIYTGRGWR